MNERYLSPLVRRRREIVADIEMGISVIIGFLGGAAGTLLVLMALEVI